MDINNQCLSVFKSFIKDIIKVFPEYQLKLEDIYGTILKMGSCNLEEEELLKEFLDRVHKLNKKITNKDESMFNEDPLLLTDISFKNIWTTNISYKTKENIWKYLQTFCLLALNHQSNKDLANAISDLSESKTIELKDKKLASDVKKIKKMTENIQEPIAEDLSDNVETTEENTDFENPLENIMGNSSIGKLAEEVSKELDLESMLGSLDSENPMDIFQNLMSGGAMNKIMGKIHNVVNTKVESGELNKDTMMNEAQGIYGQLGQNDMFQKMAQQAGSVQQQQQQLQHQQQQQQQQTRNITSAQENNPHSSNKTKARLQKKLKDKQKVQVNKVNN
jgi:hypothetical protein